jgi:hypothetical protein
MPRLFFATYDGERFASDEEGIELESIEAAKLLGQKALANMAKDGLPDGDHRSFVVNVRGEAGTAVVRMFLSLVVEEGSVDDRFAESKA